ncbi:MAG: phosphate/phosphite/phosphonate ABC transporter substrate-binding protein [Proteobacteria bacterium]|nr:phosphate/phosphite/phosphonate ABC transporter substrate-binding protein [Pseudomonadota bacterium]
MRSGTFQWIGLCACLLAGCTPDDPASYEPTYARNSAFTTAGAEYLFAVHPLHNPKRLFEVYQPLVDLINEAAAPAFRLKLETSRDYAAFERKLAARKFHVAVPNPYQTLASEARGYRIVGKMGNDQRFRGIIIVRRDSELQHVADLKGVPISFPAPTALAATMMPRMYLHQHGLGAGDINARYVGSQESAIMNVLLGKTSAAGTWPPPWEALLRRRPELAERLVIRWETKPLINNGLVVRADMPEAHVRVLETVVFQLHDHARGRAILEAMEIGRFDAADTRTFEPVRRFMREYETAFGRMQ